MDGIEVQGICNRLVFAENEAERLSNVLAELQAKAGGSGHGMNQEPDPELEKLKYRLQILKREAQKEDKTVTPFSRMSSTCSARTSDCRWKRPSPNSVQFQFQLCHRPQRSLEITSAMSQ